ncbi:MAG: hypothetical protein ACI9G1_004914 [Pirellulaceae bacterium]|jgi:hypothetical protein
MGLQQLLRKVFALAGNCPVGVVFSGRCLQWALSSVGVVFSGRCLQWALSSVGEEVPADSALCNTSAF